MDSSGTCSICRSALSFGYRLEKLNIFLLFLKLFRFIIVLDWLQLVCNCQNRGMEFDRRVLFCDDVGYSKSNAQNNDESQERLDGWIRRPGSSK